MSSQAWMAIITALAAVAGPLLAVWITRMSDQRKEVAGRRMDIFRTLMRTRKMPIHYEHVGALNLIEIEFVGDAKVIAAWKDYLKNLGERIPADLDHSGHEELRKKRETLLTKLIYEISVVLDFKVEQLEILEGNYIPQGWDDEANEQRIVRQSLINVLGGSRPILFQPHNPAVQNGPYPPAPQIKDVE